MIINVMMIKGSKREKGRTSMVQKGKFEAFAKAEEVRALKRVDFPTFGIPTIPAFILQEEKRRKKMNEWRKEWRNEWMKEWRNEWMDEISIDG